MVLKAGKIMAIRPTGICYVMNLHQAKALFAKGRRIRGAVAFAPFKSRKVRPRRLEHAPDSVLA